MKHILTTTVLFLSSVVFLWAQDSTSKKAAGPLLKFDDTRQNFGFVREGELVQLVYKYENKGIEPVIVSETKVACGCTMVTYPKIIKPGEKGVFKVNFDTTGKIDRQDRTVTVISNSSNSPQELRFKGVVLKRKGT
jgi:hypothetical protein